ncbi:MAG: DUF308 domain-containing protein [Bacteroidales bacterium]|nr:DUF308 domain-containing protein [Bacteroidales bacterium]
MKKSFLVSNSLLISGVVLILIGILAVSVGESFFKYLLQFAGGLILLSGLVMFVVNLVSKKQMAKVEKVVMLVLFAFAMLCGCFIFFYAESLINFLAVVFGCLILLSSIMMIIVNLKYRPKQSKASLAYLLISVAILIAVAVMGYIFITDPSFGVNVIAISLGVVMIVLGLLLVLESFIVHKAIKLKNELLEEEQRRIEFANAEDAQIVEDSNAENK